MSSAIAPEASRPTVSCSATPDPAETSTDDMRDHLSVLIADDEATARMLLKAAMQKEGFRVIEASNGQECLTLFKQEQPDIVLLDAVMPEMDGFSCCAALQDLFDKQEVSEENALPPILMITSLDDSQSVEQAFSAGATDYVTKPIHWALLRHRVRGLRDSIKRRQAEAEIRRSLKEKEALLKEVHHRVKNNLQIISSLLNLQANTVVDKTALSALQESQNRVRLMAMIHEKLYQSRDLGEIRLADYIQDLANHLLHSYEINRSRIKLSITTDDILLQADTAVSCGLIINELLSNSLKYAFPTAADSDPATDSNNTIEIEAQLTGSDYFCITYRDNGIGLPVSFDAEFDLDNAKTLGLQLINTLTEQLGGILTIRNCQPTEFELSHLSRS